MLFSNLSLMPTSVTLPIVSFVEVLSYSYLVRVFMRTLLMYFVLFRCMRIDQDRVGETTSMYANRPRSCRRNDLDVCESTCMRNDPHPL